MIGDLHCHTRMSDGALGVDDLILYARRGGLDFVAVTDHDTMAGVRRAEQLGRRFGIGVIGGAEFSAWDSARGRKVHLLCLLPKRPDRLEGTFRRTLEGRDRAMRESMKKVMRFFPVTEEHILRHAQGAAAVYSVHIMAALRDLGYTESLYGDLYRELLLGPDGSCFVRQEYPDVHEIAGLIRSAGGICILAHPSSYDSIDLMQELAENGEIDGVERYHPRVKEEDIPVIDAVVGQYQLIPTGGTDFHGGNTRHPSPLGSCLTMQEPLERLFRLSKSRN
ncbi:MULTISPECIES: PHP domain-containing protein [unclassified Anaerotruncus]|jgi:predicted metal-dependent phosphoesterase TrpH|uniref:PHP domain-containing protein n=1 Tax=unclassified Anaerotruncus TaxID=2641626 RepID=UPI00033DA50E|nr:MULTISPECIES: PHP domain-containing protein [unclassified Anaerotruncus]MCI9160272.1 PHP domain-containing protein [Anaerotruncus sp.]NCE73951.1 PHP domain-containing protein [Anaerotruncus sp. X29]RKJ98178.1 PHP domain-containing protein [Anaerotruncus sp. 1XD22-93]EOS63897.1 hypothetical protein C814_00631 [Anaerotruncus sp. G3(2012)]NBK17047.1 PHP domain-containing protein [Anaerotruncus sp. 1XD42-93]